MGAEMGNAIANDNLGFMYWTGDGVEQNPEKAIGYFLKALEINPDDCFALLRVGIMYETGDGVKQDIEKALAYYTRAAELGDALSMVRIGYILQRYRRGEGPPEDNRVLSESGGNRKRRSAEQRRLVLP